MQAPTLRAPAKINLTLEVLDRRPGGYHRIRSLMVPLDLADEILAEPSPDAASPSEHNLRLTLRKRIPAQAGLGGGSSDAAAVLLAAASGAFGESGERDWLAIARSLGSDVPFFLPQTGALVEGTGERVTAVGALPPWYVIVVKPPVAASTADAYRELDAHPRPSRPRNTSVSLRAVEALQRGEFAAVQSCLSNDFHDVVAVRSPEIARVVDALRGAGAHNALLAGTGSCVFSLFENAASRDEVIARINIPSAYDILPSALNANSSWDPKNATEGPPRDAENRTWVVAKSRVT